MSTAKWLVNQRVSKKLLVVLCYLLVYGYMSFEVYGYWHLIWNLSVAVASMVVMFALGGVAWLSRAKVLGKYFVFVYISTLIGVSLLIWIVPGRMLAEGGSLLISRSGRFYIFASLGVFVNWIFNRMSLNS
ncbi:hypothetical protein [Burkholderia pseudomallei]|uniref:hypothetical protein n=1 Tax=Burkholderia pseudomallei TaxID=28450 RepID=UPI0024684D66|nr:hypothetical protein [Burkholderia pseudomallei]